MPRKTPAPEALAPEGTHAALAEDVAALLQIARNNPWWEFETEDLCRLMNLTSYTASMLKRADDSPFSNDRSRPERIHAFFAAHPGWKPANEK